MFSTQIKGKQIKIRFFTLETGCSTSGLDWKESQSKRIQIPEDWNPKDPSAPSTTATKSIRYIWKEVEAKSTFYVWKEVKDIGKYNLYGVLNNVKTWVENEFHYFKPCILGALEPWAPIV